MEEKKEYDLLDLIRWGWGIFVQYCWNPFVFLVRFGLKKWYFMLLAVFIGFGIAYITPKFYKTTYSGQMIIKNWVGKSSDYVNLLQAVGKESGSVIVRKLGVPVSAMQGFRGIVPHYVYPMDTLNTGYVVDVKNSIRNSSVVPYLFAVEVRSTDSSTIRLWGDAIIHFLKNEQYVQNENHRRLEEVKSNLAILQYEMKMLDSLRQVEYLDASKLSVMLKDKSKNDLSERDQPCLWHNEMIELNGRMMQMQNTLTYIQEPLEVISPMSLNAIPSTHWTLTYKKFILLSVALMYSLLLAWHFRKEIVSFVKK